MGADVIKMLPLVLKQEAIVKILKAQIEELENSKEIKIREKPQLKVINSLRDIQVTSLDDLNQNDDAASYQSNENNIPVRPARQSNFITKTRSRTMQNEKREIQRGVDTSRLTPREIRNLTLSKKASSDSDIEESEHAIRDISKQMTYLRK